MKMCVSITEKMRTNLQKKVKSTVCTMRQDKTDNNYPMSVHLYILYTVHCSLAGCCAVVPEDAPH